MCAKPFLALAFPLCEIQQWVGLFPFLVMIALVVYWSVTHLWLGPDMYIEKHYSWKTFRLLCVCFLTALPSVFPFLLEPLFGERLQWILDVDLRVVGGFFTIWSWLVAFIAVCLALLILWNRRQELNYDPEVPAPHPGMFSSE